jgi:hypothetical protein
MFLGFEVFTVMYIKITVFSNMMSCSLVYGFHVIVFLTGSTHLPSILWNTMFIDSCMYICKSSICFTMTMIFYRVVRNSVHHVYSNIRRRLSDKWWGGGHKFKRHCLDTLVKTADCEAALSYIQVNTVRSHHGLLLVIFIFCTPFCVVYMCVCWSWKYRFEE